MTELLSLYPDELEALLVSVGEPKYRAKQIFPQLHRGLTPEMMTNIGKTTCERLASVASWHFPTIRRKLVSAIDGTVKYLLEMEDGACVEAVVMKYKHGNTVCISSQVGCRMGCRFCASTIGGRVRNLSAGEILGEVITVQKDLGSERLSGIVMMGIGEPLDNYDQVIRFLRLVSHENGICIGLRHISLSTCGLVDKIYQLTEEDLPITLSISLHAADDETRSSIMPINNRWKIAQLLAACKNWFEKTGRRISFEYTLIAGKNDSPESARKLAELLNRSLRTRTEGMPIHVNLIPVNPIRERDYVQSNAHVIEAFKEKLERSGLTVTVRREMGRDIDGACGQLRRKYKENQRLA